MVEMMELLGASVAPARRSSARNSREFDSAAILLGATDDAGNAIDSTLGNLLVELDPALQ
jgi:hypothetical protein